MNQQCRREVLQTILRAIRSAEADFPPDVLSDVHAELERATAQHAPMSGPHEGWAVIFEELDELWDEVRGHSDNRTERMRYEAIQVAAMAVRFVIDICDRGNR